MASRKPRRGSSMLSLLGSPLLLVTCTSLVMFIMTIVDVAGTLQRAEGLRQVEWLARARIAAECVAMRHLPGVDARPAESESLSTEIRGVRVTMQRSGLDWLLSSRCPDGRSFAFRCRELEGAAPAAMAADCAAVDPKVLQRLGSGSVLAPEDLPCLDERAVAAAARADQLPMFRRDKGIALLHWEAGTERDDFVLAPPGDRGNLEVPGDVVVVPGHLWIESGKAPLVLRLPRDLVIVSQGNLYVGRSVVVEGPGRLCLVTSLPQGACAFADCDGNGRWSAGDVLFESTTFSGPAEGGGAVYLGLPGRRESIHLDASLVPAGEVHLRIDASVAGPLVLPHGVTATLAPLARLRALGTWVFCVDREAVPGFQTHGVRRPGLLRLEPPNPGVTDNQGLYAPAPAR